MPESLQKNEHSESRDSEKVTYISQSIRTRDMLSLSDKDYVLGQNDQMLNPEINNFDGATISQFFSVPSYQLGKNSG